MGAKPKVIIFYLKASTGIPLRLLLQKANNASTKPSVLSARLTMFVSAVLFAAVELV